MKGFLFIVMVLAGCRGGWSDVDTKSATSAARAQADALDLCAPDAGTCVASYVRAEERLALCLNNSMLYRHGQPEVDAGIQCQPR